MCSPGSPSVRAPRFAGGVSPRHVTQPSRLPWRRASGLLLRPAFTGAGWKLCATAGRRPALRLREEAPPSRSATSDQIPPARAPPAVIGSRKSIIPPRNLQESSQFSSNAGPSSSNPGSNSSNPGSSLSNPGSSSSNPGPSLSNLGSSSSNPGSSLSNLGSDSSDSGSSLSNPGSDSSNSGSSPSNPGPRSSNPGANLSHPEWDSWRFLDDQVGTEDPPP